MAERDYTPKLAVPGAERILSLGFMGPPGGGKTWSALEVATGIQKVRGGDIILIESEGERSLKLTDFFTFYRVGLEPPFGSLIFLDAIRAQEARKPACVIVDCFSDEHEGPGGVLAQHDEGMLAAVERARARGDSRQEWQIAEAASQSAWIKPKGDRLKFILAMDRFKFPIIYTFRAREKVRQIKNDKGKMAPTPVGYQPIAPTEIVHKLDLTCLLPANARGVPVWKSNTKTEDFFIKLPEYLLPYIKEGKRIDAALGEGFARWMKGDVLLTGPRLAQAASNAADHGMESLLRWFSGRTKAEKAEVKPLLDSTLKKLADEADQSRARQSAQNEPQGAPETGKTDPPPPATEPANAPAAAAGEASDPIEDEWLKSYDGAPDASSVD